MSIIAEVIHKLGVTREDVFRVAREGGTTARDWDIAAAIEAAGGRKATDLMAQPDRVWRAEHVRLQRALWEKTREEDVEFLREKAADAGVYDIEPLLPAVVESKEEHQATATPEPEDTNQDQGETASGTAEWRELLHTRIWPDVARTTGAPKHVVDRITAKWTTARAALKGAKALLVRQAQHRPRVRAQLATYATAA
ncbi:MULTISPECIES: hypothetical protein [Nocardiopsis]|uniref:Uncharacterized protein n=1 Tax=Nocardiopsis sinuspersici TaxID=501010 RepID=A0A1V3BVR9_9ACTN|nr:MULTISPECIES: hypothetical protein [Nocardiopsis]OOC52473.1 hypothetical protein NOSIN_00335 [Nocardiopsis sinuspersici]